jgi:hypothetical protein
VAKSKKIEAEHQYVIEYKPVTDLEFDRQNPRLPHSVVDSRQDEAVIDWMLKDASIIELMGSIGEKGFFPAEPLLVVKKGTSQKFTVVEGNRRLTAVKLLIDPRLASRKTEAIKLISDEASHKPDRLPVMVFPHRKEILDYLGFKHITGVKQWSALAKAKYLKELKDEYDLKNFSTNEQYRKLAKSIGSRADYVRDLLIGLEVYERIHNKKFFKIKDLNEDTIDFGVYYNALKFSNIPVFLGIKKNAVNPGKTLKEKNLEQLTRIISEKIDGRTRLGESRNLSDLNSIILEDKPMKMFMGGKSLADAAMYLRGPEEILSTSLNHILSLLVESRAALQEIRTCTSQQVSQAAKARKDISEIEEQVIKKSKSVSKGK